jgi:deoxyribose-phosphate aldolase
MTLNVRNLTYAEVAKVIDHSLLRPELTEAEIASGCELAKHYHVASVCVLLAAQLLLGSDVLVSTVIGFPHGTNTTATKVFEAKEAIAQGARELDMVLNIGELRSGNHDAVRADIKAVVEVAHASSVKVKVILENAYLSDEQKLTACKLCEEAGADWVKTSTGFAPSGATLPDLRLMRAAVGPTVQVKAAGGVRTLDALLDVIEVGCTRCGATATAAMLDEFKLRKM